MFVLGGKRPSQTSRTWSDKLCAAGKIRSPTKPTKKPHPKPKHIRGKNVLPKRGRGTRGGGLFRRQNGQKHNRPAILGRQVLGPLQRNFHFSKLSIAELIGSIHWGRGHCNDQLYRKAFFISRHGIKEYMTTTTIQVQTRITKHPNRRF